MKVVSNSGGSFIGARLRKKWRADGDGPVTWSPPSEADTRHVGEFERLGSYVYDQPVARVHAPQVDWMDDPR